MTSSTPPTKRRQRVRRALVGLAAAAGLFAAAVPAQAAAGDPVATTSYAYTSAAGDYIGQGKSATYKAPTDTIKLSGTAEFLNVEVSTPDISWSIDLAAPRGEKLHPGVYRNAERAAFRTGRAPGLDVGGDGRGCNEVYGQFSVNQIETDDSGNVTLLDATFTQNCEGATAALKGTVKYKAYPLSYRYASDAGDYIGQGKTNSYTGSTSTFEAYGSASFLRYSVSGKRDDWSVVLAAPEGQKLEIGKTYQASRSGEGGLGQLDAGGNARGCNTTEGEFKVTKLALDASGAPKAFAATFTQHCEGATPALRGTIHYYA
ncbi:hypothetical protein AB0B50_40655 [Streptomyces sp. NPDC041068]|uniref:hypothetical protein n=1 Tax=Streptomyces sp. NPDC041068 TaxID=3155130 RepID=UPI0033EC9304